MTTTAELVAECGTNETVDLNGETFEGSNVDVWPEGLILSGGNFTGQTQVFGAQGGGFVGCSFGDTSGNKLQGLLRMRGGSGWAIDGCTFTGGIQAGQLSISLNDRQPTGSTAAIPHDWVVENCTFNPPAGQWGTYPQTDHIYILSDPAISQNGKVLGCWFSGHPYGPNVKVGGTGNNPRFEGARGVTFENCQFNGVPGLDGRTNTILVEGEKSEATAVGCTITASGGVPPYLQAVDGAHLRMIGTVLPQGITEYSNWYFLYFWKRSGKVTVKPGIKPPNVGGISWSAT